MIPKNHGRYPEAEAWIATWPPEHEVRYWSLYDNMVDLGLIPYPWRPKKPGNLPRQYVYWKPHSNRPGRAEIYLGPKSVDFNLETFSELLSDLPGAELSPRTAKPRNIKFWIRKDQELRQAQVAARIAATHLQA